MSLMAVGVIAELVAAFAVVGSVAYLAIQVRDYNREARIAAMHELTEAYRTSILAFQDGRLAELFSRAKTDLETLDEPERLQFISWSRVCLEFGRMPTINIEAREYLTA